MTSPRAVLGACFLCEVDQAEVSADRLSSLAESLLTCHKHNSLPRNTGRINSARRGGLQNRVFLHVCVKGLFTVKPNHALMPFASGRMIEFRMKSALRHVNCVITLAFNSFSRGMDYRQWQGKKMELEAKRL